MITYPYLLESAFSLQFWHMNRPDLKQAHDHDSCIKNAILRAQSLCEKRGVRLTRLRRQILELIWHSHIPLGAYELMDMLEEASERKRVAPPTVYRSLDFLLENGLIHKIHSRNAFFGCATPALKHNDALFICNQCGFTEEIRSPTIQQAINLSASQNRFTVQTQIVEVIGKCGHCR